VIQFLHVIIYDYYRIVHHHTEYYHERSQRNGIQTYTEFLHHTQRYQYTYRHCQRSHGSYTPRKQNHTDKDNRYYCQSEIAEEMIYRMAHHAGHIGYFHYLYIGRIGGLEIFYYLIHVLAEFNYVEAVAHLHGHDERMHAVALDVRSVQIVLAYNAPDVLNPYYFIVRGSVHNLVGHFRLRTETVRYTHRILPVRRFYSSPYTQHSLEIKRRSYHLRPYAVMRQFRRGKINGYTLFLPAVILNLGNGFVPAYLVLQFIRVIFQFAIISVLRRNSQQHGRRVSEIVGAYKNGDLRRKFSLQFVKSQTQFIPEHIRLFNVLVYFDVNDNLALFRFRIGPVPPDFLESKKKFL